ncbi:plasma-membrane choline transporter-domain-containing protein [Baffinella frigidus]|nr:plasma-membrane choline transporter-domain-containing protein [Cryptophyta sp. CCMP2293]
MGCWGSKDEEVTEQEITEAQGKAATKGGSALTGTTFELKEDRGCTDFLCLLILIVFWGCMLFVGILAFVRGEPARLHNGYDFNGNLCNFGSNAVKPYLYYPYPYAVAGAEPDLTWATCVKECPCQNGCPGVELSVTAPDLCIMAFKTKMDNGVEVTCGGLADGRTEMSQFTEMSARNAIGFRKYCMKRTPVCSDCNNATCCDGSNQVIAGNITTDFNETAYPELKKFGIPLGHKYGFCFVPYPSAKTSLLTRCLPYLLPDTSSFAEALNSYDESANGTTGNATVSKEDIESGFTGVLNAFNNPGETFNSLMDEVNEHKYWILMSAGIAFVVSMIYTILLRVAALPLTIVILIAIWLMLGASTALLFFKAGVIKQSQVPVELSGITAMDLPAGLTLDAAKQNQNLLIVAAVVVAVCFVIYSLLFCIMIPRIMLAIKVINIASSCVASMPTIFLCPIIQFFWMLSLFAWWTAVAVFIASVGEWNAEAHQYQWDDATRWAAVFHFFGLLWGRAFILACGQLVIAGAAAQWFLASDKKVLTLPVGGAIKRTVRYHLGTAGLGSFLIAVVQFIRWVFRYYMYQLKKLDKDSRIVGCLTCIGECCLWCLEKFLDFINKNAYIQTAINGTSFCTSAGVAASLLIRNCLRLGAITICSSLFILIGKIFIAVGTALITALIIVGGEWDNITKAPIFSMVVVVLLAYAIGAAFLDVWDMCIDTIFQAYLMDMEMGTGKATGELKNFVAENEPKGKDIKAATSHL